MSPVKSKAQARLMKAIVAGKRKIKGLSKEKAKEFLKGSKVSKLPERKSLHKRKVSGRH